MNIVADLIIIAIIVLSALLAYRKGLINLSIQLCAVIISVVIIILIYKPISNLIINTTGIDETIQNTLLEKATEIMQNENEESGQIVEMAQNEMLPETARTLSINIVQGMVIIILYILIRIALRFVTALANFVAKLPIINQFNKIGGIIYGVLRGLLIVYIALLIISLAGEVNKDNSVYVTVEQSYIGKVMSDNNILNIFFTNNS